MILYSEKMYKAFLLRYFYLIWLSVASNKVLAPEALIITHNLIEFSEASLQTVRRLLVSLLKIY